jgi:hypothetical protein
MRPGFKAGREAANAAIRKELEAGIERLAREA